MKSLPDSLPLHDPRCKLCRPALLALKKARAKMPADRTPVCVNVALVPDFNAFGVFCGWHVSLTK